MESKNKKSKKLMDFLDSKASRARFRKGFYWLLLLLLAVDLISWFGATRQVHFPWEGFVFFNAVYGFMACVTLIFLAKILRWLVRRREDYYD